MSTEYRKNHYVPVWYQKRFIPREQRDNELFYLDLNPSTGRTPKGDVYKIKELQRLGPKSCFAETDLYTRCFGSEIVTDIERVFFGDIDRRGKDGVSSFSEFIPGTTSARGFNNLIEFLSIQKLRTPKGLQWLRQILRGNKYDVLAVMLELRKMFCAIWTESIWQIADASNSPTKLIISDHPVTVYNRAFGPRHDACKGANDPDIRQHASHTIFPLSSEKILILTNLSWARNPYQNEKEFRPNPNPNPYRDAVFSALDVQVGRLLDETEVRQINFIIKSRTFRYIAASNPEWLYPEKHVSKSDWARYGDGYLFMPDPRSMSRSGGFGIIMKGGQTLAFDEYGRQPGQPGYTGLTTEGKNWSTLDRFQGEFARLFGPRRRGRCHQFGELSNEVDADWIHIHNLALEKSNKRAK